MVIGSLCLRLQHLLIKGLFAAINDCCTLFVAPDSNEFGPERTSTLSQAFYFQYLGTFITDMPVVDSNNRYGSFDANDRTVVAGSVNTSSISGRGSKFCRVTTAPMNLSELMLPQCLLMCAVLQNRP